MNVKWRRYGGTKLINKFSLYSLQAIFVFVKNCSTLEGYYKTNIKKYLYYIQEKSLINLFYYG
jgi:hypothetical protein